MKTSSPPQPTRPRLLVSLHWLTLLALCIGVAVIWVRDATTGRALRLWLLEGHRHLGLLVLGLWAARVLLRLQLGKWQHSSPQAFAIRMVAAATHAALYALLLALPLLGWALSDAQGKTVNLFGMPLPHLVAADEDLADQLTAWHVDAAWTLLALGIVHAGAALWHHFVKRDAVLVSMLPWRRS